jgi:CubicO group peptidase (beta-lactamase class C family)
VGLTTIIGRSAAAHINNSLIPSRPSSLTTTKKAMLVNMSERNKTTTPGVLDTLPGIYRGPGGALAYINHATGEVSTKVYGYADVERRIPMTTKTVMPICSISKQMLCLAIADLAHRPTPLMSQSPGDVWSQLTAELHRKLPQLQGADVPGKRGSDLTVADLYNMQSGIRDYWAMTVLFGGMPEQPFSVAYDAPQALERTRSFHFSPGHEFSYSNVNFHVLGRLVETVAGQSLEQLFAERVFIPAGMTSASLKPNTFGPPLPIVGYEGSEKAGYTPAVNRIEWSGDAGITASLEDMIAYEKYLEASLEDPDSNYSLTHQEQKHRDGNPSIYGYGLMRMKVDGKTAIGHGGGLRGFSLERLHVPSEHCSALVMFNHSANPVEAAETILKRAWKVEEPKTGDIRAGEQWKGNFMDAEAGLVVQVDVNDKGELQVVAAGKMKMKGENEAASTQNVLKLDGDVLHVTCPRDNRKYTATRIRKPTDEDKAALEESTYAGKYECKEVDSMFTVFGSGEIMYGSFDGYLGKGLGHLMRYVGEDTWLMACPRAMDSAPPGDWTVVFKKEGDKVTGVKLGCWLARNVEYVRV